MKIPEPPNTKLPKRTQIVEEFAVCIKCNSRDLIMGVIYREKNQFFQDISCKNCGYSVILKHEKPKYRW